MEKEIHKQEKSKMNVKPLSTLDLDKKLDRKIDNKKENKKTLEDAPAPGDESAP